jgi:hypothetical protein
MYPDLAFEPDLAIYSKNAPSYDAVGINVPPKANDCAPVDTTFLALIQEIKFRISIVFVFIY